jgi:hypothetical protein
MTPPHRRVSGKRAVEAIPVHGSWRLQVIPCEKPDKATSGYSYKPPSAVAANHVRSYPESGRKPRRLFTAAVDPKWTCTQTKQGGLCAIIGEGNDIYDACRKCYCSLRETQSILLGNFLGLVGSAYREPPSRGQ